MQNNQVENQNDLQVASDNKKSIEKFVKNTAGMRLLLLFAMTIGLSVITGILMQTVFSVRSEMLVLLAISLLILIVSTVRFSRWFYLRLSGEKTYYVVICLIHFVFAAVSGMLCVVLPNSIYSWGFAVTKFLKIVIPTYSGFWSIVNYNLMLSNLLSLAVFHLLLFIVAIVSPLGVRWIAEEAQTVPKIGVLDIDVAIPAENESKTEKNRESET